MSRLDELIKELCPNGVEFKNLCDISKMDAGERITKAMMSDEYQYPVMGAGVVPTGYYTGWNRENTITISRAGVGAGIVGWHPEKFWATDVCFTVDDDKSGKVNIKYLYYAVKAQEKNRKEHIYGGSMPKIDKNYLWHMQIPVPPIEIQVEIVQILDNFTEFTEKLVEELTAELTARKKQYEYYRERLLTFDSNATLKPIGSFANLYAGATPSTKKKEYWDNGTIPWMSSGEVNLGEVYITEKKISKTGYDNSSTKMLPKDTVVIALAGQGKTRGTVAITRIPLCTNQSLCGVVTDGTVSSEYLRYYLQTQYLTLRDISSGDGTRGGLNLKMIRDFVVPVPDMETQLKIVDILKRFDAICNDISSGLPAEIEARQKQYEFYRDKLLTFKELTV